MRSCEGGHIKYSMLRSLVCLVHVRATHFPFSPSCHNRCSGGSGQVGSCRSMRAPNETPSGWSGLVVSCEGAQ